MLIWVLWAIALIAQQATQTIHTRAKAMTNLRYTAVAGALSHLSWILSNFIMVDKIVAAQRSGDLLLAAFVVVFYVFWADAGGVLAQWLAMHVLEKRIRF